MTALSLREGYGIFGTPIMKFTLTYEGSLPPSANKAKKDAKWGGTEEDTPTIEGPMGESSRSADG